MGFFDRFRKSMPVVLSFGELEGWIATQKEQEEKVVADRLATFLKELDAQIIALEGLDLVARKAEPRIRAIAEGNLKKYIGHLKALRSNLVQEEADVHGLLLTFAQRSVTNYDKATLLVGEVGETRKVVNSFGQFVVRKSTKGPLLHSLKEKLSLIDENETVIASVTESIAALREKIRVADSQEKKVKARVDKQNAEAARQEKEYDAALAVVRKEVLRLKGMIDLKALGNHFHGTSRMPEVLSLKEDFEENFAKVVPLAAEAKMSTPEMVALVERIKGVKKELRPPTLKQAHYSKSTALEDELAREQKRLEKAQKENEALKAAIVDELSGIDVAVQA